MSAPILWAGTAAKLLRSILQIPGSSSGTVSLSAPSSVTDYTLTLPSAQANGYLTNTSGTLAFGYFNVASLTSITTLTTSNEVVFCSGGSGAYAITLPSPSGITGKTFYIQRTDTTVSNVITLTGTGLTSQTLNTSGESVIIVSDGSNWNILERRIPSTWVAYTPTFAGLGTVASINIFSRRVGDTLEIRGGFTTGTVAASTASMTLGCSGTNSNVTLDTTKLPSGISHVGQWAVNSSTSNFQDNVLADSAATGLLKFGYQNGSQGGLTALNGTVAFGNTQLVSVYGSVPISGWLG